MLISLYNLLSISLSTMITGQNLQRTARLSASKGSENLTWAVRMKHEEGLESTRLQNFHDSLVYETRFN